MNNGCCFPGGVELQKRAGRWKEMGKYRTYVGVSFYVPNEDEVTCSGVADVGVDGDRTP